MFYNGRGNVYHDIIIIGAGPAGSIAALCLAKSGFDVLVVEKSSFPREKICGDCITPLGVEIINRYGILSYLEKPPHKINSVKIIVRETLINQAEFHMNPELPDFALSIQRKDLDNALISAAIDAGAIVEKNTKVIDFIFNDEGFASGITVLKDGIINDYFADVIILATGSSDMKLLRKLGVSIRDYPSIGIAIRAYFTSGSDSGDIMELYAEPDYWPSLGWIFPQTDGILNAGIGHHINQKSAEEKSLQKVFEKFIRGSHMSATRLSKAQLISTPKASRIFMGGLRGSLVRRGVILIGEAAGLVNPFTGEGICYGMKSGELISRIISEIPLRTKETIRAIELEYNRAIRHSLLRYFSLAEFLQHRAASRFVTTNMVRLLNRSKSLSEFNIRFWVKGF